MANDETTAAATDAPEILPKARMKLLVVSDDMLFARLTAMKLDKLGFAVDTATTGAEAFERLKKEPFRVVLTGWAIQGMSGFDLIVAVRKLKRNILFCEFGIGVLIDFPRQLYDLRIARVPARIFFLLSARLSAVRY